MPTIVTAPSAPGNPPRRDPLDVPADELRRRIRLTLSVLGHTDDPAGLARLLRGEAGI